jgi:hypothetical protein
MHSSLMPLLFFPPVFRSASYGSYAGYGGGYGDSRGYGGGSGGSYGPERSASRGPAAPRTDPYARR